MKNRRTSLLVLLAASVALAGALAAEPVLEVMDHSRGLRIVTHTPDWGFSPIGKYEIIMVYSGNKIRGSLHIKKSFNQRDDPATLLAKRLETLKKSKTSKVVSEKEIVPVGAATEAPGLSYDTLERGYIFVEFFFTHRGKNYEGRFDSKKETFEAFRKAAEEQLGAIELLPAE